jgi:tetratricopeptide (TPR) repeat protein
MLKRSVCLLVSVLAVLSGFGVSAQQTSDYDSLVRQGNSQLQAGNNEQALSTANAAIRANTSRWEAYAVAGGALLNLKRYEEAADWFSKAIDRAPQNKQDGLRALRPQCFAAQSEASTSHSRSGTAVIATQAEIALWVSIKGSSNPADFLTYLNQYPQGAFAGLADQHLQEIYQEPDYHAAGSERAHFAHLDGSSQELNRAAAAGSLEAQMYLGYAYTQGNGVPKDLTTALTWYKRALQAHPNIVSTDRNWIEAQISFVKTELARNDKP